MKEDTLSKWFMATATTVLIIVGGSQIKSLNTLVELQKDITYVQLSISDRYTPQDAARDWAIQNHVNSIIRDKLYQLEERTYGPSE